MTRRRRRRRLPGWATGAIAAAVVVVAALIGAEVFRIVADATERGQAERFAAVPQDPAQGPPGTLVKVESVVGGPLDAEVWRIMYRSTDLRGADVIVTGILVEPLAPAPPGGRTVVSWGHPTTGVADDCAPSAGFDPTIGIEGLRMLLDRGYAVVATDYAGMGGNGPDSYLIGQTEGRNVLDAVRAARQVDGAEVSERTILWGHSQGGQAVLFAGELASTYAPDLRVLGVAAAAPAADLTALLGAHLDDISGVTIGAYAFTAYAGVYGDEVAGATLADVLTPAAQAAVGEMNGLCLLTDVDRIHAIGQPLVGGFTSVDPTTTSPWKELLQQNSAGSVPFDAPLFIAQGDADQLVIPADTAQFVAHERSLGIDTTFAEIPDATHGTVAYLSLPSLSAWLDGLPVTP